MLAQYVPVLITFALALIVVTVMVNANRFLSPRNSTDTKLEIFECGNEPSGPAWGRFSVKFYLTAILFIVFDVEVVFMYPWAVLFKGLGWYGLLTMSSFIAALLVALAYCWKKGALEWET